MRILYVGHILPWDVARAVRTSIAGNKFEQSFVKALDNILEGNLDVISFANLGHSEIKKSNICEIYAGKPFKHIVPTKRPIICDVIRDINFFFLEMAWCIRNRNHDKAIMIINSPYGICVLSLLAKPFGAKIVSFTIDTPFTPSNTFEGFFGWYEKTLYILGHRVLRYLSGIIVLNKAAVDKLGLMIPYHVTKIGCDSGKVGCSCNERTDAVAAKKPYKIVYAGTLIDYNGISTLIKAFDLLDCHTYALHIYGSGPLEHEISKCSREKSNIEFHGLVDNEEMFKVLSDADLLINPRVTSASVCDFTFPLKMTEYLLSGRPVLTTKFSSLPEEYKSFVFLIEDETPEGFCKAIQSVFIEEENKRAERCADGALYLRQKQSWEVISEDIFKFIKSL